MLLLFIINSATNVNLTQSWFYLIPNLAFSIANSGEGISKDEISLIFDRFYKTDKSRSKDKVGIGLGLYIVKKILHLHDGNIKAESIEGKECKFTFFIPIKRQK